MTSPPSFSCPTSPKGFSLVEVMVSLFIITFGLLGIASMLMKGLGLNTASFLRSTATQQAYDMGDRIRANASAAQAGNYNTISYTANQTCTACISCTSAQLATYDACYWNKQNETLLPMGRGSVTRDGSNFIIAISWDTNKDGLINQDDYSADSNGDGSNDASFALRIQP